MTKRRWSLSRRLVVVALALALVAGVALVGVLGVVWWKRTHRSGIDAALHAVPAASLRIGYTDWADVRRTLHAKLGRHPRPTQVESFIDRAYDTDFSAASSIDESAPALQRLYGFSPATAQWEAYAQAKAGATMVLKMPDADFDDLAGNLRSLGYKRPAKDDGVWRGGVDLVASIDPTITPELQYVVLLEDQHLVVSSDTASYAATAARVARGDAPSVADKAGVGDLVDGMRSPANAMVWAGDFACRDLAMSSADQDAQDQAEALVRKAGGVTPLSGLAMAMRSDRTLDVVERFDGSDQANRNLRPRARLAVGEAVGRGGSFSDDFRLPSSRSDGSTVRLALRPRERTGYVLSDLYNGPVLFATC